MKKIFNFALPLAALLGITTANAITCPPVSQVVSANFVRGYLYDSESLIWELTSAPFIHDGKTWDISYGTTLPAATTEQQAIIQGQKEFKNSPIVIPKPPADPIPGHILCDYTPTNLPYWISALTIG